MVEINKEKLKQLYWTKGKSLREIGNMFDLSSQAISNKMQKYNISRRSKGSQPQTHKKFKNKFVKKFGDEYVFLSKYKKYNKEIKLKHKKCGYVWSKKAGNLIESNGCPYCYSNNYTHQEILEKIENNNPDYKVLSKYKNMNTKIKILHKNCGKKWYVTPHNFLDGGSRCPRCHTSLGEQSIIDFLDKNNIKYKREYKFKDCIDNSNLRFDFVIFNDENKIKYAIEYNGLQHYKSIKFWGGKEKFNDIRKKDKIKQNYCRDNNIKLLIISYKQKDNINKILKNFLSNNFKYLQYQKQLSLF